MTASTTKSRKGSGFESKLLTIEDQFARSASHGQIITQWMHDIASIWLGRGVKPPNDSTKNPKNLTWAQLGAFPIPCNCSKCNEPSLIFPPEDGSPPGGYVICPRCSYGNGNGERHGNED